ncbi:MAG: hypothetical protein ACFCUX_08435 [Candidatus Methylacidiphilales bacterium]
MNVGTTLKSVEKKFGPCLPGPGDPDKTVSAIRYAAGKGKKFAGIPGILPDAMFLVHFPVAVDLSRIKVAKKGPADFINDMRQDGPQSTQGRQADVEAFLRGYAELEKKEAAKRQKAAAKQAAEKLREFLGEKEIIVEVNGRRMTARAKITLVKKTGKLKISAEADF